LVELKTQDREKTAALARKALIFSLHECLIQLLFTEYEGLKAEILYCSAT